MPSPNIKDNSTVCQYTQRKMGSAPENNSKGTDGPNEGVKEDWNWPTMFHRIDSAKGKVTGMRQALLDEEKDVRGKASMSLIALFVVNGFATILVFVFHLVSLESLLSVGLSVGFTIYSYRRTEDSTTFDGSIMTWTLLSFAIVTPLSAAIGMAFTRRDRALTHMMTLRSFLFGMYQAHSTWDWVTHKAPGRLASKVNWLEHSDAVLTDILGLSNELTRYLTLPQTSRARHRMLPSGQKQAAEMKIVGCELVDSIMTRVNTLSLRCEVLKMEGLPGNEAARIRQWERDVVNQIEQLLVIKEYRTPQALRSLCRIFSVLLPPFYAPYYAEMAINLGSLGTAIAFSVVTSVVLTALFESLAVLEDPFVASLTLDGIDVPRELQEIQTARLLSQRNNVFFPNSDPFKGLIS